MTDDVFSAGADIVLRSSDGDELKAHMHTLSAASPFFHAMFTLPQPVPTSQHDCELPIIDMPESSSTLQSLLHFIYPIPDPDAKSLVEIEELLITADKYEFDGVLSRLRSLLITPTYLTTDPIRIYALTSRFDFVRESDTAARATFRIKPNLLPVDLYDMDNYALERLKRVRSRHGQALQRLVTMPSCLSACQTCNGYKAGVPRTTAMYGPPRWWKTWKVRARKELEERPCPDLVFDEEFMTECAGNTGCEDCRESMEGDVSKEGMEVLKRTLDELPLLIDCGDADVESCIESLAKLDY